MRGMPQPNTGFLLPSPRSDAAGAKRVQGLQIHRCQALRSLLHSKILPQGEGKRQKPTVAHRFMAN